MKKKPLAPVSSSSPRQEVEILRQKIADQVAKNPEKAAIIISEWLKKTSREERKKTA